MEWRIKIDVNIYMKTVHGPLRTAFARSFSFFLAESHHVSAGDRALMDAFGCIFSAATAAPLPWRERLLQFSFCKTLNE